MEMSMETEHNSYQDEGIDLYDLWLILKKKWLVILIVTFISTGFAVSYAFLATKVYRVHNILVQDVELFNQTEMAAAVSVLDKLNNVNDLAAQEKQKVFNMLGVNNTDIKVITNFKSSEIKGSSALWVDIDTTDRKTGVALMENLPRIISSNPNITNKIKTQKTLIQKNMEDLKAIINNPTMSLKLSHDAIIYLPSIDLYALREKYNNFNLTLEKIDKGQIVSLAWKTEFPQKPIKPRKAISIMIGLVMGCFLGIFIAFFMEWVTKERHIHSNDSV
jgi:putative effector of murein hydrolase